MGELSPWAISEAVSTADENRVLDRDLSSRDPEWFLERDLQDASRRPVRSDLSLSCRSPRFLFSCADCRNQTLRSACRALDKRPGRDRRSSALEHSRKRQPTHAARVQASPHHITQTLEFQQLGTGQDCRAWTRLLNCRVSEPSTPHPNEGTPERAMKSTDPDPPWYREGWPSPAPDAVPAARERRGTSGSRSTRSSGSPASGARRSSSSRQSSSARSAPITACRTTRRRLHLLGLRQRMHGLRRPARPMPDLAVLARKPRDARGLGTDHPDLPRGRHGAAPPTRRNRRDDRDSPFMNPHTDRNSPVARDRRRKSAASLQAPVPRPGPGGRRTRTGLASQRPLLPVPGIRPHAVPLGAGGPLLLADAPQPVRPLDDGATCPWQDAQGRCTAREARPLGCRVYFCDPSYEPTAPELTEQFLGPLKQLADEHGWPWNYAPLHQHLHQAWTADADGGQPRLVCIRDADAPARETAPGSEGPAPHVPRSSQIARPSRPPERVHGPATIACESLFS